MAAHRDYCRATRAVWAAPPPARATNLRRTGGGVVAIALLAASLVFPAHGWASAPADPALAPYRDLARSPAAARLLALARAALESHWDGAPVDTTGCPDWPGPPTGLYLSLARGSVTRSCVGSATPRGTLAESVRALAVAVVASDTRRPPVRREELPALRVILAFAGEGEPVADPMRVDPGREGLLVGGPRGHVAFLPGEARTVAWALREARRLGVLDGARPAEFIRFPVVTIAEPEPRPIRGEASE